MNFWVFCYIPGSDSRWIPHCQQRISKLVWWINLAYHSWDHRWLNTNKTYLYNGSIHRLHVEMLKRDCQPFPQIDIEIWILPDNHSGKSTLEWHERWAQLWTEYQWMEYMTKRWHEFSHQWMEHVTKNGMNLDSKNFGLSPMQVDLYMYSYI